MNEKIIPIFEHAKPSDRVNMVNLYVNDNLVESTHNLVVYKGREFAVQRILDVNNGAPYDLKNYKVTHFGIGDGGAESNDNITLLGPQDNDTSIYKGISLSDNSQYLTYTDQMGNTINGGAKPITLDGSIEIIRDSGTNKYTTAKVTLIIDPSTNDSNLTTTFGISEAALFYTDNTSVKGIFAHVCFSRKFIDPTDKIKIEWYLLF